MERPSHPENYSTLEVDRDKVHDLPVAKEDEAELPQVINSNAADAPEVVKKREAESDSTVRQRKIWGLRRRTFWILLAIGIFVIVGAAVGGGVGGALANKGGSSQPSGPPQILPNSNIAAVNYTDAQNVTHYRVYFQATTSNIFQSDYNNSTAAWTVSPIQPSGNRSAIVPLNSTSLSAHVNLENNTNVDFHLFFIDSDNTIRELTSTLTDPTWVEGDFKQPLPVVNSSIASSGKQCQQCSTNNTVIFQSQLNNENTLNAVNESANGASKLIASTVSPVLGSGMALTQLLPDINTNYSTFALYVNAGNLQEITYNATSQEWALQNAMETDGVVASLSGEAHIAAWCTVQNNYRHVTVLSTTSSGGVQLISWSGVPGQTGWTQNNALDGFEDVEKNSAITFNEDGRVYAFETADDGTTQLTEWVCKDGSTFDKVGGVNTTVF